MSRVLAIDYGTVRVGLAISDPLQMIAQPYKTLPNNELLVQQICNIVAQEQVAVVVVGKPLKLDGSSDLAVEKVAKFFDVLKRKLPDCTIAWCDERLTTAEAQKELIKADVSRKGRKQIIDSVAASLILRKWLEQNG